jgi:sec-independent protein translocase protein TatB
MFDIGWSELVVIGVVALIAIGPKELPGVLRAVGQWMGKIRRMASEFQGQFQEAMREAEMADLKKSVDEMTDTAKSYTNFDPIGIVRNEIENATADKPPASSAEAAAPTTSEAASEATPAASPDTAPPAPEVTPVTDAPATAPEQKPGGAA